MEQRDQYAIKSAGNVERLPRSWIVWFALAFFVVAAGGVWLYHVQAKAMRERVENELTGIARLKTAQIAAWRKDQLNDAALLGQHPFLAQRVARFLAVPEPEIEQDISIRLDSIAKQHDYVEILLLDAEGNPVFSLYGEAAAQRTYGVELTEALRKGKPIFTKLRVGSAAECPPIRVLVPLHVTAEDDSYCAGALILVNDPARFLFPLIEFWPALTRTAETLLMQRETDELVVLNEPRHHPEPENGLLRIPLRQAEMPAVKTVREGVSFRIGKDYRGAEVASVVLPVRDSPWLMEAKVDVAEVFAAWRLRSILLVAVIIGVIALLGAVTLVFQQSRSKAYFRSLYRSEAGLRKSVEQFRALVEGAPDAIFIQTDFRFAYLNPSAVRLFGAERAEQLLGKPVTDHFHPAVRDQIERRMHTLNVEKKGVPLLEKVCLRLDGGEVPAEVTAVPTEYEGRNGALVFARDISERRRHEEDLRRLEWMLRADHKSTLEAPLPEYGDLVALNEGGVILRAVGRETLKDIVSDYLELLDTSAAVYERNGDYACGIFSSGWCRLMDTAARRLCETDDNREALASGKWLCHESCWEDASKVAIETGEAVDIDCAGGLRLYAVPVRAGNEIVGAINFGYGDPPTDAGTIEELACKYKLDPHVVRREAAAYESRPSYIVEMAKRRIAASARLIGEMVERDRAESRIQHLNRVLRAIRDVNQLITHEPDRDELLHRACDILVSMRGYRSAWVALRNADGTLQAVSESGIGEAFSVVREGMQRGDWPECCRCVSEQADGIAVMHDTDRNCKSCMLSHIYRDTAALAGALRHGDRDYGVLVVALPAGMADDQEEQSLFRELIGDVAYALSAAEAAAKRKEQQALLEAIYCNAPLIMMVVDGERRIQQVNGFASHFANRSTEDMLGLHGGEALRCLHALDDPRGCGFGEFCEQCVIRKTVLDTLENGTTHRQVEADYYFSPPDKQASTLKLLVSSSPLMYKGERMALVTMLDITERKALENQLRQAQKMESIGRLAGGVAHDFNNLLMGIMNYVELCRESVEDNHPIREWLDEIGVDAQRSAAIVRQLLAFSRKQTIAPEVLDLNDAVGGMLKMLRRLIGEDIDLCWQPCADVWSVKIDPGQIDQILANLCVNARDAVDGVGKVTIETENVSLDDAYCAAHAGFVPGDFAMLAVSDDGCGMDRETLDNVFDPFFTTKPAGEGTGLGLAMIYGIVKQNEGFVNVYSEPGEGTVFKIYLPRFAGEEESRKEAEKIPESVGGTETILLVEDEKSIRFTMQLFLDKLGYNVLVAETPEAALALAAEYADTIDLLITDVVMPGMNGRDLAEKLAADHPSMKVLYMSGYTANVIAHRGILDNSIAFLSKPFTRDEVARKVREVLEDRPR